MRGGNPVVLMIEDNENAVMLHQRALARHGYVMHSAGTLAAARQKLQNGGPVDMVLLDIGLPDGDGLTFLPELRTLTGAPVMVVSGRRGKDAATRGLQCGADAWLQKPYKLDVLCARVGALLR